MTAARDCGQGVGITTLGGLPVGGGKGAVLAALEQLEGKLGVQIVAALEEGGADVMCFDVARHHRGSGYGRRTRRLVVQLAAAGQLFRSQTTQLYENILSDSSTFAAVTLETVVAAIEVETGAPWIGEVRERYLAWEAVEGAIRGGGVP